jgi:hypothetical protein
MQAENRDPRQRLTKLPQWQELIAAQARERARRQDFLGRPVFVGGECPGVRDICADVVGALIVIADSLLDLRDSLGAQGDVPFVREDPNVGEELRAISGAKCSGLVYMAEDLQNANCNDVLLTLNEWLKNCIEVL